MVLTRIKLERGQLEGFPNGITEHGYEFVAPLDNDGRIDPDAWPKHKKHCWVRRFGGLDTDEHGFLKRQGERRCYFDYRARQSKDNELFFKLDKNHLVKDSYVSITEHDGVRRRF